MVSAIGLLVWLATLAPVWFPLAPSTFDSDVCTCREAIQTHAWCGKCQVGYAAGLRITSALLFEAMDTHGHEIKPETMRCPGCRAAVASDGLCEFCHMGFVNKRLFFTPLTYLLALGKVVEVSTIECPTCSNSVTKPEWCAPCQRGIVGNVQFAKQTLFKPAVVEYQRLRAAVKKLTECEDCSIGIFMKARCIRCKIDYGGDPAHSEEEEIEQQGGKSADKATRAETVPVGRGG